MTDRRRRWRLLRRIGLYVFMALVAILLVRQGRHLDWAQVGASLRAYPPHTLAIAAALSGAGYALYACYDLAARRYARHALPAARTMAIAAIAYAFSVNLGAVVGGAAFRYRLYAREGLGAGTIARIVAFAIGCNWVGYLLLAGVLFASGRVALPPRWPLSGAALPWLGAAMLLAVAGYVLACHLAHGRVLHVRGRHFRLPSPRLALLQMVLAAANWSLMATVLWLLMPPALSWTAVLAALLVAAIATAIAHIPAGLGVMEAVFIPLLGHLAPVPQILAALLAYRACYYLAPLLLAIAGYGVLEARRRPQAAPVP